MKLDGFVDGKAPREKKFKTYNRLKFRVYNNGTL